MKTKKQALEEAHNKYIAALTNLRIHEAKWKAAWDAAKDPFRAWEQHKKSRPQRDAVVKEWLDAKDFYLKLKERK